MPADRPGSAALITDLKAARITGLHHRRLGRRVRSNADERSSLRFEVPRAGSPCPRIHDVDGGGRHQAGRTIVGRTDDVGYNIAEDPVSVHDLHATLLHLMGIDHTRLTYRFQGRDFRLTDVEGQLVKKLLA